MERGGENMGRGKEGPTSKEGHERVGRGGEGKERCSPPHAISGYATVGKPIYLLPEVVLKLS